MAAPPNLPPVPTSDTLFGGFHPLTDTHYTAMDAQQLQSVRGNAIPPLAPTPPPADMGPPTPVLPRMPEEALQERRRSADRSRNASQHQSQSRSRSRSRSRSSEHSASDDGESDGEESSDPRYQWRPITEDKSEPCEDEMAYIESRTATEHSALDHAHFEEQTFFELNDVHVKPIENGRIDWLVERFNGTKEEPNNERVMRSPVVHVGGYDWRIAFHPKGNSTDFLSVYVECVPMQQPEWADLEDFAHAPFPFLAGENEPTKKRRSVAAQVSVCMYNPAEPRTYEFKQDAHRYSKLNADFGWRYFAHREDFYMRRHAQRQAILRDDKLAFKAYIRVVDDPTRCMWSHDHTDPFKDSLLSTSLRPFPGYLPHLAALIPLLHFMPFRQLIMDHTTPAPTVYRIQTMLWKLYSRTRSISYGRRPHDLDNNDAVSCLRSIVDALGKECDKAELVELFGSLDPQKGALVSTNRLQTKSYTSVEEAIKQRSTRIETPGLLAVELQRQEFDTEQRKWKKLTNRVEVNEWLEVNNEEVYQLFAVVTHSGDLQSNKHKVYVRPVTTGLWYAYDDRRVTAMTTKQAVTDHEGIDGSHGDKDRRRDSPFSGVHEIGENETIYLALYTQSKYCKTRPLPKEEAWAVPEEIRKGLESPKQKQSKPPPASAEEPADMPFRVEQIRFKQEQREREIMEMEAGGGPSTPEWPLTDEEGDTLMSDAEDDSPLQQSQTNVMAASITLAQIPTKPSRTHKWYTTIDGLGQDYYEGEMFGDKYQGEGRLVTMSGDVYVGMFYQGKREGHGKMTYASNGNVYEGEWLNDLHHGHGTLTEAATGNVYEGGWKEGVKHGQFVLKGQVTEEDRGLCTICYEREMTTAFYDCGHVVACKECAARIDNCPMCRRRVVGRLQLYGVKMTLE